MIGRLLCAVNLHKWRLHTFKFAQWKECARCEEVKDERHIRGRRS